MSKWISNTFEEGLIKINADKIVAMKQIIKDTKERKKFTIVIWVEGIYNPLVFEYETLDAFNSAWNSLEKLVCK